MLFTADYSVRQNIGRRSHLISLSLILIFQWWWFFSFFPLEEMKEMQSELRKEWDHGGGRRKTHILRLLRLSLPSDSINILDFMRKRKTYMRKIYIWECDCWLMVWWMKKERVIFIYIYCTLALRLHLWKVFFVLFLLLLYIFYFYLKGRQLTPFYLVFLPFYFILFFIHLNKRNTLPFEL